MAQLYKMTLYVCDLNENLNLDDIKTLIKERALDSCSVNCLCHFADEKVGQQVEWHDDTDLNYTNCTTETWDKYFNKANNNVDETKCCYCKYSNDIELTRNGDWYLHCSKKYENKRDTLVSPWYCCNKFERK